MFTMKVIILKAAELLEANQCKHEGGQSNETSDAVFHRMLCSIGCCVSSDAVAYRVEFKKIHRQTEVAHGRGGARGGWNIGC